MVLIYVYLAAFMLCRLPSVENVPIKTKPQPRKTPDEASQIKELEYITNKALLAGKLKEALLLEELLENEILRANLRLLTENYERRNEAVIEEKPILKQESLVKRQKRGVDVYPGFISSPFNANYVPMGYSGASTAGFLGLSPVYTNLYPPSSKRTNRQANTAENEIAGSTETSTEESDEESSSTQSQASEERSTEESSISNESGGNDDGGGTRNEGRIEDGDGGGGKGEGRRAPDLFNSLYNFLAPLSDLSMAVEGSEGGLSDIGPVINLAGPLLSSLLGGSGNDDFPASLAEVLGPLSVSISGGGEDGRGSNLINLVTSIVGPLSASVSGGSGEGSGGGLGGLISAVLGSSSGGGGRQNDGNSSSSGGSNLVSLVAGLVGPLSSSSSGGNPEGPGGFNIAGTLLGLAGPLSASLSAGSSDGDGSDTGSDSSGGSGGLITGLLGSSSGGSSGSGDSTNNSDDDGQDTVGSSDLTGVLTSLLSSSSGGGGDSYDSDGGSNSGNILLRVIVSLISSLSTGDGNGGGGGNLLSGLLGSSSGSGGQSNGNGNGKGTGFVSRGRSTTPRGGKRA